MVLASWLLSVAWHLLLGPQRPGQPGSSVRPGARPAQGWAPLGFLWGAPLVTLQGRAGGGYRSHLLESGPRGPASTLHSLNPEHVALTRPGPAGLPCGLPHGLCLNWALQRPAPTRKPHKLKSE